MQNRRAHLRFGNFDPYVKSNLWQAELINMNYELANTNTFSGTGTGKLRPLGATEIEPGQTVAGHFAYKSYSLHSVSQNRKHFEHIQTLTRMWNDQWDHYSRFWTKKCIACWKLETFNYLLPVDKQQNFGRRARGILRICNVSKQHLSWGPLYMRVLGQDPGIPGPALPMQSSSSVQLCPRTCNAVYFYQFPGLILARWPLPAKLNKNQCSE